MKTCAYVSSGFHQHMNTQTNTAKKTKCCRFSIIHTERETKLCMKYQQNNNIFG